MIDANAIADLQMLMNTGDGRQAVLSRLLQSDKFAGHRPKGSPTASGVNPRKGNDDRHRLCLSRGKGAQIQPLHHQRLQSVSPARIRHARLPANIIRTLDRLPQEDKAPLINFTEGLAHRVNNIFMAVVGHFSIVMHQLDRSTTAYRRLHECEELIHNTALLIRLLVDVFHRSQHASHTLYPIDLSDQEINQLIFASDIRKPPAVRATLADLSVHKIQMIMAAMVGRRLHRIFHILQHQTAHIFQSKDLVILGGKHHQAIFQHLKRGIAIATDLMYYANAVEIDRRPTDLNAIIEDAVASIKSASPALKIEVDTIATPVCLKADARLLRRMLGEILTNANDANPHGGVSVKISTAQVTGCDSRLAPTQLGHVNLMIEDDGAGMSERLGIHAFEPFTTWPRRRKRGMGLAVVLGIVKAHGGRIRFFNRLGGGFVLIIDLPL